MSGSVIQRGVTDWNGVVTLLSECPSPACRRLLTTLIRRAIGVGGMTAEQVHLLAQDAEQDARVDVERLSENAPLTMREVAIRWNVAERTVAKWIDAKRLPATAERTVLFRDVVHFERTFLTGQ